MVQPAEEELVVEEAVKEEATESLGSVSLPPNLSLSQLVIHADNEVNECIGFVPAVDHASRKYDTID